MTLNLVSSLFKENKGKLSPLLINSEDLSGPALMNPTVLVREGSIFVNLRNVNYTLYHSETSNYEHAFGPLVYVHPEADLHLRTTNYLLEINPDLSVKHHAKVDTSKLDVKPLWEFVGLEDARLVDWDNKLFLCGVRRDTTTNGVGRMELSEIEFDWENNTCVEVSRHRTRIPNENEYCNKNWMPILNNPYHFIKWCNPLEIIHTGPNVLEPMSTTYGEFTSGYLDWRGGSQVVEIDNCYVCIVHETNLFKSKAGRKNAIYRHRFLVFDKNWNRIKVSKEFSFLGMNIEFCCGLAEYGDDLLITFGAQDNAAYILRADKQRIMEFINEQ